MASISWRLQVETRGDFRRQPRSTQRDRAAGQRMVPPASGNRSVRSGVHADAREWLGTPAPRTGARNNECIRGCTGTGTAGDTSPARGTPLKSPKSLRRRVSGCHENRHPEPRLGLSLPGRPPLALLAGSRGGRGRVGSTTRRRSGGRSLRGPTVRRRAPPGSPLQACEVPCLSGVVEHGTIERSNDRTIR
jgi:hypothetical protein